MKIINQSKNTLKNLAKIWDKCLQGIENTSLPMEFRSKILAERLVENKEEILSLMISQVNPELTKRLKKESINHLLFLGAISEVEKETRIPLGEYFKDYINDIPKDLLVR